MTWSRFSEALDEFYRKHMPRVLGGEVPSLLWAGIAYCTIVFLALFLSLFFPAARAEEPAYWPPCGELGQDSRCPPPPRTPLPGHTQPEVQCSP
jgi:hypothetical protein